MQTRMRRQQRGLMKKRRSRPSMPAVEEREQRQEDRVAELLAVQSPFSLHPDRANKSKTRPSSPRPKPPFSLFSSSSFKHPQFSVTDWSTTSRTRLGTTMDFSRFAPPLPSQAGPTGRGGPVGSRDDSRYGGQLAGQMSQMGLGQQSASAYNSQSYNPPPSSSSNPSSSSPMSYPAPSSSAGGTYDAPAASYGQQGAYKGANYARPAVSSATTTSSAGGGGFSGASRGFGGAGAGYPERTASSGGGGARPPRNASLPSLPSSGSTALDSGFAEPAPPLPHPSSSPFFSPTLQQSQHSSFASIPPSATSGRDSNFGGEAVFDGAALAAGSTGLARNGSSAAEGQAAAAAAAKRANPLQDLIATETQFVEDVGVVIKVRLFPFPCIPPTIY